MADDLESQSVGKGQAYKALAGVFAQGFRFLATINGIGVIFTLLVAVGFIQTDLAPQLFRMPLAAFLGGLALCGVGLLWAFLAQASLFGQLIDGRRRRTHWVPLACALLAYGLSLVVFVVGCWFTLGLANLAYYDPQYSQRYSQSYRSSNDKPDNSKVSTLPAYRAVPATRPLVPSPIRVGAGYAGTGRRSLVA